MCISCWEESVIKGILKGCLTAILVGIGLIILLVVFFFSWASYTSPVNKAGRDYRETLKSYEGTEIQSIEDVYERIHALDTHYNSPTFSKMQGGDKVEVTPEDIETLFGTPDQVITDVDVSFMDTVYQYYYDDFVLNLHEDYEGIETFVTEKYSGALYEEQDLTELFFEIIGKHQAERISNLETAVKLPIEEMWPLIGENLPTREVYKNGWSTRYQNHFFYFDDGKGKYAPEEYLNLQLQSEKDTTELQFMERRFNESFLTLDTKEEAEAKHGAYSKYKEFVGAKNSGKEVEPIYFRELAEDFGDIAKLHYRFRNGEVWVSWLILQEDGKSMEIRGEVRLTKETIPEDISDIMHLEIRTVTTIMIHDLAKFRQTADFLGQ